MSSTATQLSRELGEIPGVENVAAHIGRAVTGDRIVDVNSGDLWVRIASDADYEATVASIEEAVGRLDAAVDGDVATYSTQELLMSGHFMTAKSRMRAHITSIS